MSAGTPPSLVAPMTYTQLVAMMAGDLLTRAQNATNINDLLEGAVALTLYEGVAAPLEELMYRYHVDLPLKFFVDQATGAALARLVSNITFGQVVQTSKAPAHGNLLFVGNPGAEITPGIVWQTAQGIQVTNDSDIAIQSGATGVTGAATATLPGTQGNLIAGTVLTAPAGVIGITQAVVQIPWTGGLNDMSDLDLRQGVVDYFNSLFKGVKGAVVRGCRVNGYFRVFVSVPLGGRIRVYVDDGLPVNPGKLAACLVDLDTNWVAGGIITYLFDKPLHPILIRAQAFTDGSVSQSALESGIAARWAVLMDTTKRMGDPLTLLELEGEAARVAGYNGVNIYSPAGDITVKPVLDMFNTQFGAGVLLPWEKVASAGVVWGAPS